MSGLQHITVPSGIRIEADTASPVPRWYRRHYRFGIESMLGTLLLIVSATLYYADLPSVALQS